MIKITARSLIFCSSLIGFVAYAGDFYVVKGKDSLTDILEENDLEPIYGPNGNLAKLIKLNPYLKNNSLHPGLRILLPEKSPEKLKQIAEAKAKAALKAQSIPKVETVVTVPSKDSKIERTLASTSNSQNNSIDISAYKNNLLNLKLNAGHEYIENLKYFSLIEAQKSLGKLNNPLVDIVPKQEFKINDFNLDGLYTREIRRIVLSEYPSANSPLTTIEQPKVVAEVKPILPINNGVDDNLQNELSNNFVFESELSNIKLEEPKLVNNHTIPKYLEPNEVKFDEIKDIVVTSRRPASTDFEQPFWADGLYIQHFSLDISPSVNWRNILSQDQNIKQKATINALTEMNYGVHLQYNMHMNEGLKVYSFYNFERTTFIADSSINLPSGIYNATELGAGVLFSNKWDMKFSNMDQFYLTSPNKTTVNVRKIALPKAEVGYFTSLYSYKAARIQAHFAGIVLSPRNTPSISTNFSMGGRIEAIATLKNQSFTIGYENYQLKAVTNSTNSENIYWLYNWNL